MVVAKKDGGRQRLYEVLTPAGRDKVTTPYDAWQSMPPSRGSLRSTVFSRQTRSETRTGRSTAAGSRASTASDIRLVQTPLVHPKSAPSAAAAAAEAKPPYRAPRERVPTRVRVRRIKSEMAQDDIRPELCFAEEPVGTSFLRHTQEDVPRWFFSSRANTFWGAGKGKSNRKLDLARLSDFNYETGSIRGASRASSVERDLIAHRIPPTPSKPEPVEFPPLAPGQEIHWHSLPMEGELEKHLKQMGVKKGRQGEFTRYVGAVEPGKYRTLGQHKPGRSK